MNHLAGAHEGPAEACEIACLHCGHPCKMHLIGTKCRQEGCACVSYVRHSNGEDAWPITVSCLMITTAARAHFAKRAIACFDKQTYPFRELIIVSVDDVSYLAKYIPKNGHGDGAPTEPSARRTFFQVPRGLTLGDMRNLSIGRSKGYFIATWDDDDIHAPERLARQMATLRANPHAGGCALRKIVVAWQSRNRYAISMDRFAWENTLLARRWKVPCYPALPRGSDTPVVESMKLVTLDDPHLYVYNIHDGNTWSADHFEGIFRYASRSLTDEETRNVIDQLGQSG